MHLTPNAPGMWSCTGFLACVLRACCVCLWFACGCAALAQETPNYQLLVDAKMAEIKWKEADLQAAERELAILDEFLGDYEAKAGNLDTARQQLAAADAKLATIQEGNLVKLTLRMGFETYNTVSDTINFGKSVATSLVTHGVRSAVGSAALDKLTNGLTSDGRAALGMDTETLGSPRAVKIKAVSDAARATYPELGRVQQMLGMSLEGIKAAAYHEDGTVLGDTGAILRKNIMVRDEIAAAMVKLDALAGEASSAKVDADVDQPAALAEVTRLRGELTTLQDELAALKTVWRQSESSTRLAANEAAVVPPADLPIADPPPRLDGETDAEYQARAAAAVAAAALARWDSESPQLLADIAACKGRMATAVASIGTTIDTCGLDLSTYSSDPPNVAYFIVTHVGDATVDVETTSSYDGAIEAYYRIEYEIGSVASAGTALPGLIAQVETLSDEYTTLQNLRNALQSLADLLGESGAGSPPASYAEAMGSMPGGGQVATDALAAELIQVNAQLPAAMANAQAKRDKLLAATSAWGVGIGAVQVDIDTELAAAESALDALVAQGYAWNTALASSAGFAQDFTNADLVENRLGYFDGGTFVPVVRWVLDMEAYRSSLYDALAVPGSDGLAAAQGLRNRYDSLVALTPPIKDAYDSAWHRFMAAYANLEAYASASGLPILGDIVQAGAHASETTPVDTSGVTDQDERFASLYDTMYLTRETSSAGGEPIFGEPVLVWRGLQTLRQIPDPGFDDPSAYLPHRMLAQKTIIHDDGPTWMPLDPAAFDVQYAAVHTALLDVLDDATASSDTAGRDVVLALMDELAGVYDDYCAAHPQAVITEQPLSDTDPLDPGAPFSVELSVTATGDFLTYQWYVADSPLLLSWTIIEGATSRTYVTPPLVATSYYRVHITNPGGTTVSDVAQLGAATPPPMFTSADSAGAQVGVPFTWTFTTDPAGCTVMLGILPPGLSFDMATATLSGMPLDAGSYEVLATASNGGMPAMQFFQLTIAPGTLPPYESWVVGSTTPEQRMDPEYVRANGRPAGDGVDNLLKFAFNLVGTGPGQAPSLGTACNTQVTPTGTAGLPAVSADTSGRLVLHYVRRKESANPGVSYVVESTESLASDSWIPLAGATETVTSIDDTWERVEVVDTAPPASGTRFVRVRVLKP